MFIEPKDLHLRLVFSPCLRAMCIFEAAGISTRGGNGNPESGHWHWRVDCCPFGGFCTYSPVVQNWSHSPPERSVPTSCRSDAEAFATTWTRTSIFLEAATSSDRLARVTWPPDHLTSLAPYWPNTWATSYLSWKGSGASQSGSIWSTERDRLVLREVRLLEHLDLNLRLEHFSKQIPPWQSSVRANVLR